MNYQPTPAEHRLLWLLVANRGEEFEIALKPTNPKSTREALKQAGLIEVEKRQKPSSAKRKVKSTYLRLTEAGWTWCNQDMSWPLPRIKSKADLFLHSLLPRLKSLFESQGTAASLADFINKSDPVAKSDEIAHPATVQANDLAAPAVPMQQPSIEQRIRGACLELGGGHQTVRIRIADLRKRLPEFAHDDVTNGLRQLAIRNELTLYPFDDPRQITPEDEAAAMHSSTGVPQHILYFGGIAS